MDARDYSDGKGSVKVRAKIKVKDDSTITIKEIPPTTTTDSPSRPSRTPCKRAS